MEAAARIVSIVAFAFFGVDCLFSQRMAAEFERYGLGRFRRLIGALEVLGALGLLAGYVFPPLVVVSAGGLAVLMLLGVVTRIRIGDPPVAMLPAAFLFAINGFIFAAAMP